MQLKIKKILLVACAFFVGLCSIQGYATILNVPLMSYIAKIPSVPKTAGDAFKKCVVVSGVVSPGPSIAALQQELERLAKESAVPYGMEDMAAMKNKHSAEGMESKLAGMSMEQKMAFAMKFQQQMGYGQAADQNQAEFISQCVKLTNEIIENDKELKIDERLSSVRMKYDSLHGKIDNETEESEKSCPILSSGEMSAPDQACIKRKRLAGMDTHIRAADAELAESGAIIAEYAGTVKKNTAKADSLFARVKYGESINGTPYKEQFRNLQTMMLAKITVLNSYTSQAIKNAAEWIERKNAMLSER